MIAAGIAKSTNINSKRAIVGCYCAIRRSPLQVVNCMVMVLNSYVLQIDFLKSIKQASKQIHVPNDVNQANVNLNVLMANQ